MLTKNQPMEGSQNTKAYCLSTKRRLPLLAFLKLCDGFSSSSILVWTWGFVWWHFCKNYILFPFLRERVVIIVEAICMVTSGMSDNTRIFVVSHFCGDWRRQREKPGYESRLPLGTFLHYKILDPRGLVEWANLKLTRLTNIICDVMPSWSKERSISSVEVCTDLGDWWRQLDFMFGKAAQD